MKKIIIMASGNGSNFENIVKKLGKKVEIKLFTEKKNAYVIQRAKKLQVKTHIIDFKSNSRDEFNYNLYNFLKNETPDLIVLAGYMKILPPQVVGSFKIINIHPSLLPAFPGINSIKKAFDYGVKVTGVTVHWVDEGLDTGKIIKQKCLKIDKNDSLETLENRIHTIEHEIYPNVLKELLDI
ncbi:MAG: phosphoribosylglycinamide formyltransferase [Thermotogota bacterium]